MLITFEHWNWLGIDIDMEQTALPFEIIINTVFNEYGINKT